METLEILKTIKRLNPTNERMDNNINQTIIKEFEEKWLNFYDLHDLHQKYIIYQQAWGSLIRWIWLTDSWKDRLERNKWIENENTILQKKIIELEKEIRVNKSLLRHPFFVSVSTAIITVFLTYIITK